MSKDAGYSNVATALLPMKVDGRVHPFTAHAYRCEATGDELIALVRGSEHVLGPSPLVRMHSGCLTGDALGSQRCDCRFQLESALQRICEEGAGVLVYLHTHEGRGIGLANKIRAYALQDIGRDTVDANLELGLSVDARSYAGAAFALRDLGASRIRLLSNNPEKIRALEAEGVTVVERVPIDGGRTEHNRGYIDTKVARMSHLFGCEVA
ncbi:GTP cyclohydrolase II [Phenylobacterium sp.]|uniref:GTP cyclohydrolase II n=1 Tax=Phenylobacterium sp. TaxID=1871053 RepID=UPI003BA8D11D